MADVEDEAYGDALRVDGVKGIVQTDVVELRAQGDYAFLGDGDVRAATEAVGEGIKPSVNGSAADGDGVHMASTEERLNEWSELVARTKRKARAEEIGFGRNAGAAYQAVVDAEVGGDAEQSGEVVRERSAEAVCVDAGSVVGTVQMKIGIAESDVGSGSVLRVGT